MADIFLSYARRDQGRAEALATAAAGDGRSVWWDRRLAGGGDSGVTIEQELDQAECVLVAWSGAARDSLWVRGEASEALDQGKLVQINLDGAKPPLPFNLMHWIDFRTWGGHRDRAPWSDLKLELDAAFGTAPAAAAAAVRRPDPGGVPIAPPEEPALLGFRTSLALGSAAIGTAIVMAVAVLLVVRGLISADGFAVLSILLLVVAALLLAACLWRVVRTTWASRR
jgi:hypothetical protein